MWAPPINESAELTRGALYLILYSKVQMQGKGGGSCVELATEFCSEKIPRNRLRYTAEENAHSEDIPRSTEEPIPKLGTERNYAENNKFYKTSKIT